MPKAMENFFLIWTKSTLSLKPLESVSANLLVYA